jgi:membrane protein YqaA with SNARE-associated domain
MALAEWLVYFQMWSHSVAEIWGYPGIFLISLIGNATIIFPVPSQLVVLYFGSILNPWLVGIVAGIGAALGELTGYALGRGGKKVIEKKYGKHLKGVKIWFEKIGMFPLILFFAMTPLPDDVTGILGGIIKYDIKKFLLATAVGKVILHIVIAWAGFYGSFLVGGLANFFTLIVLVVAAVIIYNIVFKLLRNRNRKNESGR